MMRLSLCFAAMAAAALAASGSSAWAQGAGGMRPDRDLAASERVVTRRAPVRIDIYGNRVRMVRVCEPVFEERWIPQWGGNVLYAGQSCRWVPPRY
jgi:hypothetical protein